MPRLGAVGGALASAVVFWTLFVTGWVYTSLDPFYARFVIVKARPRWSVLREQVQLGIPMGLSYAIEATSFTFITLMVARLGTSVMAGHQIVCEPRRALLHGADLARGRHLDPHRPRDRRGGPGAGAAYRGDRDPDRADRGGGHLALAVWTLRHPIVRAYTSDAAAGAVALTLVPFLAVFHLFDALQTAVGFVLRAHKRAVAPTVVYALALWGVGLVGGYQVAFRGVWGPPRGSPACG